MTFISLQEESNNFFREYQNGCTNALGELYRRWNAYVINQIQRCNVFESFSDVEDVGANVWILVQENAKKWDVNRSGWYLFLQYKIRSAISVELRKREHQHNLRHKQGYIEVPYQRDGDADRFYDSEDSIILRNEAFSTPPEPDILKDIIDQERLDIVAKAMDVCEFPSKTKKVIWLRLQGCSLREIKAKMKFQSLSCVSMQLHNAVKALRQVIDPVTHEVSETSPKSQRKHEKQQFLSEAGKRLRMCIQEKGFTLESVSRRGDISIDMLKAYLAGKRKPQVSKLNKLAALLGEAVYDIWVPPLSNAPWQQQGQTLWRLRVKAGLTFATISKITGIPSSILTRYEHGELKLTAEAIDKLSKVFHKLPLAGKGKNP